MTQAPSHCTESWCEGEYKHYRRHRRLGQKACEASRIAANIYQAKRDRPKRVTHVKWTPGSSILVPEIDPL